MSILISPSGPACPVLVPSIRPSIRPAILLLYFAAACLLASSVWAQSPYRSGAGQEKLHLHETEQWRQIQQHLPDPATASPHDLEQQADILRARRFPGDALEYYRYAMARGGDAATLLNKIGLTQLEIHNVELARACFRQAVKIGKKNSAIWNNLGAVEYLDRGVQAAIKDYKRAIKLDQRQAVYHANLATVLFEVRDFKGGRREMSTALRLDPNIFDNEGANGGVQAHVLSSQSRARFAFEMAKLYAVNQQVDQMLHSLAIASEAGMDVQHEMQRDLTLAGLVNDPRVVVLVHNAQLIRGARSTTASVPAPVAAPGAPGPVSE